MSDLELDENLQPVFTEAGDYSEISGVESADQAIKLAAQRRLYGVSSRFKQESIESKIRLAMNRIANELDFIQSVEEISVNFVSQDDGVETRTGYKVDIRYNGTESYREMIDQI